MSKIAFFQCLGKAKIVIRTARQQLNFDISGVQISIAYEDAPTEVINFEQKAKDNE